MKSEEPIASGVSRRNFLAGAGLIAGGAALGMASRATAQAPGASGGGVEMRRLGRTGLSVSCISVGTGSGQDPSVLRFARKQGINFFHTSTGYSGGKAISNLGEAIRGRRDDYVLGLKITWTPNDDKAMDAALQQLGVESVDVGFYNIHNADKVGAAQYREGAERWKAAGKIRWLGLTSHGDVLNCMKEALQADFYDVLMPAYNLDMEEEGRPILEQARKQDVGVVLMKTRRGLGGDAYHEAVPEYLATPGVTTLNKGMSSFAEITRMIQDSRVPSDQTRHMRLREAARLALSGHCAMSGTCNQVCPQQLAVSDVVRCSDYYLEQAEYAALAGETYRALPNRPERMSCGDCSLCAEACPQNVPIAMHINRAQELLS